MARVEAVREEDAAAVGTAVKEWLAADGALATAVELGEQLERSLDQREETRLAWAGLGRGCEGRNPARGRCEGEGGCKRRWS